MIREKLVKSPIIHNEDDDVSAIDSLKKEEKIFVDLPAVDNFEVRIIEELKHQNLIDMGVNKIPFILRSILNHLMRLL